MHYVSDPKKPLSKKPSGHARSQQRTVAKSNETGAVGKAYWPVALGKPPGSTLIINVCSGIEG